MIRKASHSDIESILTMGERFYETTSYAKWTPFCRDSSRGLVEAVIDNGILLIAESDGKPIGMVGLAVAPFMYNNKSKAAYEVFWWVEPEFRGGMAAWRLLKAVQAACEELNVASIQMTLLSTSPELAATLYERAGYKHTETSFTKILGSP